MQENQLVLEPSTNTHTLTNVIEHSQLSEGIIKATVHTTVDAPAKVLHGEHHTIGIESENILKYVQMEINPITKKFRAAFD